jgi:hypothetical protein
MVQSYPIFALAMAAAVTYLWERKILKLLLINIGVFFIYANIFQITQYNSMVLHYHDMNWKYYSHVYLNPNPTPLDFSLLDTQDFIEDESDYVKKNILELKKQYIVTSNNFQNVEILQIHKRTKYLKVEARIASIVGIDANFLNIAIGKKELAKIRLKRPLSIEGLPTDYAFYVKIPEKHASDEVSLNIVGWSGMKGELLEGRITEFH